MRTITTGQAHAIRVQLQQFIDDDDQLATLLLLEQSLDVIEEELQGAGQSVAVDWIWCNPAKFAAISNDVLAFFAGHYDNPHIATLVNNPAVLEIIPQHGREQFVRDLFMRHGYTSGVVWVQSCLAGGFTGEMLSLMIQRKLIDIEMHIGSSNTDFVRDFLDKGAGLVEVDLAQPDSLVFREPDASPWGVMTDAELLRMMELCVIIMPEPFLGSAEPGQAASLAQKLRVRLPDEVDDLLDRARRCVEVTSPGGA